jgi:outer membrane protein OmpA-like peptidoglycan-associated protein
MAARQDRPVAARAPEPPVALRRGVSNAAVARRLDRSVETAGHQEASWARPATTLAAEPVHVGTIHFRTKESALDAADREVLKALADAYAPHARRNVTKPKEPQGLRGRIVGFADPRVSAGPDNQALSEQRAEATGRELQRQLVRASRIEDGHFELDRIGAGVAPGAPAEDAPAAEGNQLAPFRKADVFLSGVGAERVPDAPAPAEDKRVKPPNLDDWDKKGWERTGWDRFDSAIEAADKREIAGMARQMLGWTVHGAEDIDDSLEWSPVVTAVGSLGKIDLPKIGFKKPPWWDNRGLDLLPRAGRGGLTEAQKLTYKGKLLKRDFIETAKWSEIHFTAKDSTFVRLSLEVAKDNPDRAKIQKWVLDLEYLRFMIDDVQDSGVALSKLAE